MRRVTTYSHRQPIVYTQRIEEIVASSGDGSISAPNIDGPDEMDEENIAPEVNRAFRPTTPALDRLAKRNQDIDTTLARLGAQLDQLSLCRPCSPKPQSILARQSKALSEEVKELMKVTGQESLCTLLEAIFEIKQATTQIGKTSHSEAAVEKIGESTFSEVFRISRGDGSRVALKIMPLCQTSSANSINDTLIDQDRLPCPVGSSLALHELCVIHALEKARLPFGFCPLYKTAIVSGRFPADLVAAWRRFSTDHDSENSPPTDYLPGDLHVLIAMQDGGRDLESLVSEKLIDCRQADAVIKQIMAAMALAEECLSFEHRDL